MEKTQVFLKENSHESIMFIVDNWKKYLHNQTCFYPFYYSAFFLKHVKYLAYEIYNVHEDKTEFFLLFQILVNIEKKYWVDQDW